MSVNENIAYFSREPRAHETMSGKRRLLSMWNQPVGQVRQQYGKIFCESFQAFFNSFLSDVFARKK